MVGYKRDADISWMAIMKNHAVFQMSSGWQEDVDNYIPIAPKSIKERRRLNTKFEQYVAVHYPDYVGKEWAVQDLRSEQTFRRPNSCIDSAL